MTGLGNRFNRYTSVSEDGTEIYITANGHEIDLVPERAEDLLLDLGDALNIARYRRQTREPQS